MRPPDEVGRIAVVRALHGLGDMLCVVPALRGIRASWRHAEVTLVGVPRARWMLERWPHLIDEWIDVPHWPGIPEATGTVDEVVDLLAEQRPMFDLAFQLHGSGGTINGFTRALGARRLAGHHEPGEVCPDGGFIPWPGSGHEIERMLAVVRTVGCAPATTTLDFPELDSDVVAAAGVIDAHATGSYAVVHPGASRPDRRWSVEGFAAAADHLHDAGLAVVITGDRAEVEWAEQVATACIRATPTVVAGTLTLGGLAATVRRAACVVVNDTGVAHLGVACGTPTVVVGTTSDLPRWAPLDRTTHAAVQTVGESCADRCAVLAEITRALGRQRA
jgi:ADP-heptose:LPS heptosyltransferase